jgi:hypothetical protein
MKCIHTCTLSILKGNGMTMIQVVFGIKNIKTHHFTTFSKPIAEHSSLQQCTSNNIYSNLKIGNLFVPQFGT